MFKWSQKLSMHLEKSNRDVFYLEREEALSAACKKKSKASKVEPCSNTVGFPQIFQFFLTEPHISSLFLRCNFKKRAGKRNVQHRKERKRTQEEPENKISSASFLADVKRSKLNRRADR